jgi:hypothetical protein
MDPIMMVLILLLVVALAVGAALAVRQRRRAQLRERFGPEYNRVVGEGANVRDAEAGLRARVEERETLDLRTLSADERGAYDERWQDVQAEFVDRPDSAIIDADALVGELMHDLGYPVADFERQANLISVDHPEVVAHYRDAHRVFEQTGGDAEVSTEELRKAIVSYRALFAELLHDETNDDKSTSETTTDARTDEPVGSTEVAR